MGTIAEKTIQLTDNEILIVLAVLNSHQPVKQNVQAVCEKIISQAFPSGTPVEVA